MKRNLIQSVVLCVFLLLPTFVWSARVGVLRLKVVDVTVATADIVADLLASELSNYGHQVLNPDAMDAAVGEKLECYEVNCASEVGFKAKVERVIFGSVSRLGDKHIVQLSVVNVAAQDVIWTGNLTAKTAEDLDIVAKRLAKAIAEGRKPEETVEVGIITEEEEKKPMRRQAFFVTGPRFGTLLPLGGYGGSGSLMYVGWTAWYEVPNMAVELCWDIGFSGDLADTTGGKATENIFDISLLYFFNKGDFSPFVKGGAGISALGLYDEQGEAYGTGVAVGFGVDVGGGLTMFRTYDFRLMLEGTYHLNFVDVEGFDSPHHGPKFMLGVLWRITTGRGCLGGGLGRGCW